MTVVTQIKRDAEQACVVNQSNVKHMEEKFEIAVKESKEAPETISQSIQKIHQVASSNVKTVEFMQDRASYLRHVILTNRNDTILFLKELENLRKKGNEHKDQHQKDLQQQKSEQQEIENDLNVKISAAIHQLKGLRFLQELRYQLEQQTISVNKLIEEEKVLNSDDLTSIRRQIFDQREFYENDLKIRLKAAKKFAKEFSDLHVELVTTKIMNETAQNRKKLQEISASTIEVLRENDVLRKKYNIQEQHNRIIKTSVDNLQSDFNMLKLSIVEYEEKEFNTTNEHKSNLMKFKYEKDDSIGELKLRKEEALQRREQLKQELAKIQRELHQIEAFKSESYQKEYEMLDTMNQTATFILTAIDKSIDAEAIQNADNSLSLQSQNITMKSPKTSPRNLKYTKNNKTRSQKSELSKLMLKLQDISRKMKEDTINSQCTLKRLDVEKKDIEVQTDQIMESESLQGDVKPPLLLESESPQGDVKPPPLLELESLQGDVQPPSLLESTNPRRKTSLPSSRRVPPILLKTRTSISKKRTLTRPIHV